MPPRYSITKYKPPSPAIIAPDIVAVYLYSDTLIPAASAVAGFSPTALKLSPLLVLLRKIDITIAKTTDKYVRKP